MKEALSVHGSIIFLLKKFVNQSFPPGTWEQFIANTSLSDGSIEITKAYSLETVMEIINTASEMTGIPAENLKIMFGEHMVPDLFQMYKYYLKPEWRTYEILLNTEEVMHGAVRKLNSTANPPILNVSKISENLLMVDYYSKRRMSNLAVGIIKGIAKYYGEDEQVTVETVTNPDAERVQLKIHFARNRDQLTSY